MSEGGSHPETGAQHKTNCLMEDGINPRKAGMKGEIRELMGI